MAPLTTSILALPAFSASSLRIGSAWELIAWVRAPVPLSSTVSTRVSCLPVNVTRTWITENGVVTICPVPVRTGPLTVAGRVLTRRTSGSGGGTRGAGMTGGRLRTLASRATTAAVASAAGTARRASARPVTRTPR